MQNDLLMNICLYYTSIILYIRLSTLLSTLCYVPLEIDLLGNIEQSRSHCIDPTNEYNIPGREVAKYSDAKQKLNDI